MPPPPDPAPPPPERLEGAIERVTFHSEESGFSVLRVKVRGQRDLVTVVGNAATVTPGEHIECLGSWVNDRQHGRQFRADHLRLIPPSTLEGIEKYLGSGLVRGIGPHFAKTLVRAFGEAVFEVIEQEPERLLSLEGIGPKRQARITQAWAEQKAVREQLARFAATYTNRLEWERRAATIRAGLLEGAGLSTPPRRADLRAVVHSRRQHDGYSVENVYFESLPGFFVCGNLYRPLQPDERMPGLLCPHGHSGPAATGGRFAPYTQTRCAALARMGATVFAWSMVGWEEQAPYPHEGKVLAFQLWNGLRAVDFLLSCPQMDPRRVGITGESGGGTQTFLLTAIEPRLCASVPVVMVSAHFYGGCLCESGLPIHRSPRHETCNVEFAALAAPRPQLVVSVGGDWTKNTPAVEFPYLQNVYRLYQAADAAENVHLPDEKHDYGPSKREAVYRFFARRFGLHLDRVLGPDGKMDESFVAAESPATLLAFDAAHPRPAHAVTDRARLEALLFNPP